MDRGDRADQLHDDDGLAHACAAEDAGLAALGKGAIRSMHLDAGLEDFHAGGLFCERWRQAVDRVILAGFDRSLVIYRSPKDVENATQRLRSNRHADRRAGRIGGLAALQTIGCIHRNGSAPSYCPGALHFQDQRLRVLTRHLDRFIDFGKILLRKLHIDHTAGYLGDTPCYSRHAITSAV